MGADLLTSKGPSALGGTIGRAHLIAQGKMRSQKSGEGEKGRSETNAALCPSKKAGQEELSAIRAFDILLTAVNVGYP